jgi:hypothetical protein
MVRKITVTIKDSATREVEARWVGNALALHKPIPEDTNGKRKGWTITHLDSGLIAEIYKGPYKEALRLVKTWDPVFFEELKGSKPDTKAWPRVKTWCAQVLMDEEIQDPTSFDYILKEYNR